MISPKQVFDNPSEFHEFFSVTSDDQFEGQHFERKEIIFESVPTKQSERLKSVRTGITKTISAFANTNVEGGLLILGISSDGTITGIDRLSEEQKNSLTLFSTFLHHQTAQAKEYKLKDPFGEERTICIIYVPHSKAGICETPSNNPEAWSRMGPQNISMSSEMRDRIKTEKGLLDFENTPCCEFSPDDVDDEILTEFRKVFHPQSTDKFDTARLLYEAGAIVKRDGKYWFTHAGLLFFGSNPQMILATSYIRVLRFEVSCNQFNHRGLPTLDRKFAGPLIKQIQDARIFFRESAFFKRYQRRKDTGGFIEEPEFPPTVIDEAIVNSVAHRDYRTGLPIECEAYQDAFIVKNPGRILQRDKDVPDEFSLSDTTLDSRPRNSKLIEWLRIMKRSDGMEFVQAISEGTKQMLQKMTDLNLPAPWYRLGLNETLLKLENNFVEREAAILLASQIKSTEFANLFPLSIRNGDSPVIHEVLKEHYRELLITLRDALKGNGWYIDKFAFSRIVAHKKGVDLDAPSDVKSIMKFYPAYELQIRQYHKHFYLCIDYRCQVHNVLSLNILSNRFEKDNLLNLRCIAKSIDWREGRIVEFNSEFAKIFFYDSESEHHISADLVIPHLPIKMLKNLLDVSGIHFDLHQAIKSHSLAFRRGSARERYDKMEQIIDHIADTLFPIQINDLYVDVDKEPLHLVENGQINKKTFPVYRLYEPKVLFRNANESTDIISGIVDYGSYDTGEHEIEIIPVCLREMTNNMRGLIKQLQVGKYKYRGAENTFTTRFSYQSIVGVDSIEETEREIRRLLEEHSDWKGNHAIDRIFLVHVPEHGYARDDHNSPYYRIKRYLLEAGIPSQMVDTSTLTNIDWKDLNLALNLVSKCGIKPWVLPDSIPDADFFIGLSYTQSRDGQRIMGFANVFSKYGNWEFYSGSTSYFDYEQRTAHLAHLVEKTLLQLKDRLSITARISFHYSAKMSATERTSISKAARKIVPEGIFSFVWINSDHNVRFYDNRPETDGSLRRGSYVQVAPNQIYLSTTGYNAYRQALGTPKPLEITGWTERPNGSFKDQPDLRVLGVQVLNLTKLNWASTNSFCGLPVTLKYAGNIAYLTAAFLRQSEPFKLHPVLERTPWFI